MTLANTSPDLSRQQNESQSQSSGQSDSVEGTHHHINVGGDERWISTVGGAALVVFGLSRASIKGLALAGVGAALVNRGVTGHCAAYKAMGIDSSGSGAEPTEYARKGFRVERSFTINKPAEALYNFWHDFSKLPSFMTHLKSVEQVDPTHSHWIAQGPAGTTLRWDAEIINDIPNRTIAWRSMGGADVDNAGSVSFLPAPHDRGTEVKVVIDYIPPAGKVGSAIAWMFSGAAEHAVQEDLRRFKNLMESGEIPTLEGQARGTCKPGAGERQTNNS